MREYTGARRPGNPTLTDEQVCDIRKRAAAGEWGIQSRLAKEYGVGIATINFVVKRKTYKKVEC